MSGIKLRLSIEKKNHTSVIKIRPVRNIFLDPRKYAEVWIKIINLLMESDTRQELVGKLITNLILLHEKDLYDEILKKIENGEYKVLASAMGPQEKITANFESMIHFERRYLLFLDSEKLDYLVDVLSDKDAFEILIFISKAELEKASKYLEKEFDKEDNSLNYRIFFNGIHIGMNIEVFSGTISVIKQILSVLKSGKFIKIEGDF